MIKILLITLQHFDFLGCCKTINKDENLSGTFIGVCSKQLFLNEHCFYFPQDTVYGSIFMWLFMKNLSKASWEYGHIPFSEKHTSLNKFIFLCFRADMSTPLQGQGEKDGITSGLANCSLNFSAWETDALNLLIFLSYFRALMVLSSVIWDLLRCWVSSWFSKASRHEECSFDKQASSEL